MANQKNIFVEFYSLENAAIVTWLPCERDLKSFRKVVEDEEDSGSRITEVEIGGGRFLPNVPSISEFFSAERVVRCKS